jgi:plasmid stabilization system protein ParE
VKIVWTEPARRDLPEIVLYIAEDNPYSAHNPRAEIRERQDRVEILAVYHGARKWPKSC